MTIAQMRQHVRCRIGALPPRTVSATEAVGSTLAEAHCSDADLPSLDTSAMDGYAVSGGGPWLTFCALRSAVDEWVSTAG
jgi:molybdopterin molybdotransferase